MKAESSVTVWHFEEDGDKVTRIFFPKVHLYFQNIIAKSGIKEKGIHRRKEAVVRIPVKEDIPVSLGDYIAVGEHTSQAPDYNCAFKVTSICDNRKGRSSHWKLLCGGRNDY